MAGLIKAFQEFAESAARELASTATAERPAELAEQATDARFARRLPAHLVRCRQAFR